MADDPLLQLAQLAAQWVLEIIGSIAALMMVATNGRHWQRVMPRIPSFQISYLGIMAEVCIYGLLLSVNSNMHCLDMSLMHPELATSRLQERRFSLESAGVGWTNGKICSIATLFYLNLTYAIRLDCINSFIG